MSDRYARQRAVPEIGNAGQAKLAASSVLLVGAGGLGSAVLQSLCGAGVGRLVIVDHDRIEENNLHRQPLYRMRDIGRYKAYAARDALAAINPEIHMDARCGPLTPANVGSFTTKVDVVVDAADSFAVTYTLSDACQRNGRALVSASVNGMSGYVGAFCGSAPSYRAVFPDLPPSAGACAQTGVLGTAVAALGALQAQMVIALLLGLQPQPLGRIVVMDLAALRFSEFGFSKANDPAQVIAPFVAASQVTAEDCLVDLRSADEAPVPLAGAQRIGIDETERLLDRVRTSQRIVLCCRSGLRAWRAANKLHEAGHANLALLALPR